MRCSEDVNRRGSVGTLRLGAGVGSTVATFAPSAVAGAGAGRVPASLDAPFTWYTAITAAAASAAPIAP